VTHLAVRGLVLEWRELLEQRLLPPPQVECLHDEELLQLDAPVVARRGPAVLGTAALRR
jgi:hypothetical protein